jgi:hypothetical protein
LHKGGNNPVLCLINLSDHHVELEKGEVLAYAEEVCSKMEPVGIQKVEVAKQEVQGKGEREIPEHLLNLFEKSKGELTGQEQGHLRELLCEFEDVFAKKNLKSIHHRQPTRIPRCIDMEHRFFGTGCTTWDDTF